ncbi:MAG: hypothetical protein ACRC92_20670 [Peptostreptococcaceae bacterium]
MENKDVMFEYAIEDISKVWDGVVEIEKTMMVDGKLFTEVDIAPNKVLVGGLIRTIKWIYGKQTNTNLDVFETDLYVGAEANDITNGKIVTKADDPNDKIRGFNLCIDGSLGGTTLPYPRHKKGYDFDNLIPFRMIHMSEKPALFSNLRNKYLHHREVVHDGERYIQFFTKKINVTAAILLDDGTEVPTNPDKNLNTDQDSRGAVSFPVFTDKEELVEYFRLMKAGGAESTCFSSVLTMMGKGATLTEGGETYDAMIDTIVYSRANHASLPKGVNGVINVTYSIKHI